MTTYVDGTAIVFPGWPPPAEIAKITSTGATITVTNPTGPVVDLEALAAAVASVFGRTGAITAQTGDYTAAQVGALPSTDDLSAIATANPTAGNWSNNSHKITSLANGSAAADAAAFGQIPAALPPNGAAGGDLSGTYPNPGVANLNGVAAVNYVTLTGTQTLTNKRDEPRLVAVTQSATPAMDTDNGDIFTITGLAQAITSMTTNLTGTPADGEKIEVRITDNGTARAITWGASFASTTVALPTTTVISTRLRVSFEWDSGGSVWACIGTA